jgi:hypothetical protein
MYSYTREIEAVCEIRRKKEMENNKIPQKETKV